MNALFTLVLLLLASRQQPQLLRPPSLLGTWTLQAVRLVTRPAAGAPAYRHTLAIAKGFQTETFAPGGRWCQHSYGRQGKQGTYQLVGRRLLLREGAQQVLAQVQQLTPTRLVLLRHETATEGVRVDATTTYVRAPTPPYRAHLPKKEALSAYLVLVVNNLQMTELL